MVLCDFQDLAGTAAEVDESADAARHAEEQARLIFMAYPPQESLPHIPLGSGDRPAAAPAVELLEEWSLGDRSGMQRAADLGGHVRRAQCSSGLL